MTGCTEVCAACHKSYQEVGCLNRAIGMSFFLDDAFQIILGEAFQNINHNYIAEKMQETTGI